MRLGRSAFDKYTSEGALEKRCRNDGLKHGLYVDKMTNEAGAQDRIVTGKVIAPSCVFVELKAERGYITPLQYHRHVKRCKQGYGSYLVRTFEDWKRARSEILKRYKRRGKKKKGKGQ